MAFKTKFNYAIRALADVSKNCSVSAVRVEDVATRSGLSHAYLEQIFRKLREAGMVKSLKGPHGGYALAKPTSEITVKDILVAVGDDLSAQKALGDGSVSAFTPDYFGNISKFFLKFDSEMAELCAKATLEKILEEK